MSATTLLYVEDTPVNVYLVQAIFEPRPDIRLLTAAFGDAGLTLARLHLPKLILLDMNLPDMDGLEFLRILRAEPAIAAIPVIIVSADAVSEQRKHYLDLGVTDYIAKPFDLEHFERLVDRYLNRA